MSRSWLVAGLVCFIVGCGGGDNPTVEMVTDLGTVRMELFEDRAPITVKNFLQYVEDKHYDGVIFHRVIPSFMVQCGGFTPAMSEKPTRSNIKNESTNGLKNDRGTLAMARTNDPDSASAQFFINVVDNPGLNRNGNNAGYAVFGKVISGMDVVDQIRRVPTGVKNGHEDVPVNPVVIQSIRRLAVEKK